MNQTNALLETPVALPPSSDASWPKQMVTEHKRDPDTAAEWVEAMRRLKDLQPQTQKWTVAFNSLLEACRDWLRFMKPWVKEIGVHLRPRRKIDLFVLPESPDERTLQQLRLVAELEIILGAVFKFPFALV